MDKRQYTLQEIAKLTSCELIGDPSVCILGVSDLESAGPNEISFLDKPVYLQNRYVKAMHRSKAAAIFIHPEVERPGTHNYLVTTEPSRAFQAILELFNPRLDSGFKGIHPTAIIHESAKLGEGVCIHPYAVIDAHVVLGAGTFVGAHCYIGQGSKIGENCELLSHSVVRENSLLGNRVILQPGAVIGSCGFGYTTSSKGLHQKLGQVGFVEIGDDVEIGANATVDKARLKATKVGKGSKLDNLVQIAHNVEVGDHCLIAAQSAIAGSSKLGNHSVMAGQTAIAGHITVAPRTVLVGRCAVTKTITKPGDYYGGFPATLLKNYHLREIHIKNLDSYVRTIKELDKRLTALEKTCSD